MALESSWTNAVRPERVQEMRRYKSPAPFQGATIKPPVPSRGATTG
ncbi:MAG: hypothetical protein HY231_08845 [Acidobacteria bacterium]|nr:hypothetical protein [Acidobacteriota bacterium]